MIPLLAIFVFTYVLIATEKVDKTIAACLGASAVVIFRFIPYPVALEHVDLNVLFLLIGMMTIVNILSKTGLFEWIAIVIAQKARGNGIVIVLLFLSVVAVFSAFLDNVTTVILVAPITILITQILEIPTLPVLVLEAIFSNIGGTATLVGDPPNILIGSSAGLTFNQFLVHLGPVVLIIAVVVLLVVHFSLRRRVATHKQAVQRVMRARPELAIIEPRNLKAGLAVFALVLVGFFCGHLLDVDPGIIALAGGFLMALVCRAEIHHVLEKVEWATILFFVGLFILVGALQENGVFIWLGEHVVSLTQGHLLLTCIVILWFSAITSSVVDNIPLVIALIPLIKTIIPDYAESAGLTDPEIIRTVIAQPLYWSLALGACLGGNGTLVGASANVVLSQIARKNKYKFTFWTFTRTGIPVMILSLVISTLYIYLRYF
ncbi:MAG: ArsB/NhaD family transporter [Verrucomicrobia bacterium]|nr:ArsB/NhaD family transporter [Verrucomicrobiota bacterium]